MDRIDTIALIVGLFSITGGITILLMNAEVMRLRKQVKQIADVLTVSVELTSFLSKQYVDSSKEGKK
jgi:hypothetical protein